MASPVCYNTTRRSVALLLNASTEETATWSFIFVRVLLSLLTSNPFVSTPCMRFCMCMYTFDCVCIYACVCTCVWAELLQGLEKSCNNVTAVTWSFRYRINNYINGALGTE